MAVLASSISSSSSSIEGSPKPDQTLQVDSNTTLPLERPLLDELSLTNGQSKRQKLRSAKSRVKVHVRNILGVSTSSHSTENESVEDHENNTVEEVEALETVLKDPAFNPSKLRRQLDIKHAKTVGGPIKQTKAVLDVAAATVAHPRKAAVNKIKRKAAQKISSSAQGPPPPQQVDRAYLEYERAFARSDPPNRLSGISTGSSTPSYTNIEQHLATKGDLIKEQHDSMRVAWITTRTSRVKVVPKTHMPCPSTRDLKEKGGRFDLIAEEWLKWLGKLLLYATQDFTTQYVDDFEDLPFDIDTLRTHVERLILASAAWQTWLMDVRSIYRWEDWKRTLKFLALYVFFWYNNFVMTYFWCWILYKVIKNRIYPSSAEDLKAAAQRAGNRETVAFQLGEMIDRHGREEWIDPFLNEAGPYAQVQINDLANLLEVLSNFYNWKSPYKTMSSLVFFAACLSIAAFTSSEYSMKIAWFVLGGSFFFCWPVASLYPRYRLLVSPMKWVLWGIPTHAEWSFQYLRYQAQTAREAVIAKKVTKIHHAEIPQPPLLHYTGNYELSTESASESECYGAHKQDTDNESFKSAVSVTSILSGMDLISFRAHWDGLSGRLIVHSAGLRFVRNIPRKEVWNLLFSNLEEMWKVGDIKGTRFKVSGVHGKGKLCIKSVDGHIWVLDPIRERDECFNSIIGFSGLQWQNLQILNEHTA